MSQQRRKVQGTGRNKIKYQDMDYFTSDFI